MSNIHGVSFRMDWAGWYVPERAVDDIRKQIRSASLAAHRSWCDAVLPLLPNHYPWDGTPAGAVEALVIHIRKTSGVTMTLKQAIEVCKASNDAREEFVERPSDAPYGYCPLCGARGMSRERRPNGNDRCDMGHTYPSSEAMPTPKGA